MPTYWKTKDGTQIDIVDMDDNHLTNTIKFLVRRAYAIYNSEISACASFSFNGEMAQMEQDDFLSNVEAIDYVNPIYFDMVEEARSRGLTFNELDEFDEEDFNNRD